ncbi:hypothetical protein [Actinocatenispora rupis]|uniref:Uncharacterized protein n=1 Tax=Actinocatenispora rupis TaxID=519421 RepID=A0A8J3NDJ3_9ACTN|nr:hypothetical protein [Actinocatenispora rupis]GID15111.1 hypothetical protein Aru02nite_60000 [Actinocatenispora rupis]
MSAFSVVVAIVSTVVSLAVLVLVVITCVSVIRLSVHIRSGGRRYAIDSAGSGGYDEDDDGYRPARYRPRRPSTNL